MLALFQKKSVIFSVLGGQLDWNQHGFFYDKSCIGFDGKMHS